VWADNLAKYLMTECGDGRLAGRQTMLGEQNGNRPIGSAPLAQLDDDILRGDQVLELLRSERRKFRDRLTDCGWVK
jgi:hypothetical protein